MGCGACQGDLRERAATAGAKHQKEAARSPAAATSRGKGLFPDRVAFFIHRLFDRRDLGQTRVVFHDDELAVSIAGDEADAGDFLNGRVDSLDAVATRNIGDLKRSSFQVIDLRCA